MLEVCSLWVGREIPPHLAACIESFVTKGHPFTLYGYGNADAPKGVTQADGEDILGRAFADEFIGARKFSQLSNYFRYEMLAKRPGVCWVDVDMYCLRPLSAAPYIFGWEDEASINGAVLAIPPDSDLLASLRAMFLNPNFVAPWLPLPRRVKAHWAATKGAPLSRAQYPWGTFGPKALTWFIRELQLQDHARPVEYFYPMHYTNIDLLFDAEADWNTGALGQARTLHLWNEKLRMRPDLASPPVGSFLWRLLREDRFADIAA